LLKLGKSDAAMYVIDERDRVAPIDDLPQSSVGAPCPIVMQDEFTAVVAYYVQAPEPGWTGETVRVVDPESSAEPAALVRFRGVCAAMFGRRMTRRSRGTRSLLVGSAPTRLPRSTTHRGSACSNA
jgi:hypothetical protein